MKRTILALMVLSILVLAGCSTIETITHGHSHTEDFDIHQNPEFLNGTAIHTHDGFEHDHSMAQNHTHTTQDHDNIKEVDIHEVNLVVTSVGFNPIFYPLDKEKVEHPIDLEINLIKTSYSQAELYTLVTDDIPTVGILSGVNLAKAANEGQRYQVLAPYYREIVGPGGFSVGQVVAMKDSSINSPKDFEGKTIGIQGEADGSTLIMKTVLKNVYQVDLSKVEFIAIDSEMAPALIRRGDLDAAMFDSDFIFASDFNANYKTVLDFGKEMKDFYGTMPPAKFFVAEEGMYLSDPEAFHKAVDFFRENYKWSLENLEEITQLEAQESGDDYSFLLEKTKYEKRMDSMTEADAYAWKAILETAYAEGVIEFVPDVNWLFAEE